MFQKKSLGQNFLTNPAILKKIADAAQILPQEHVVEIGPGRGALTEELLRQGAVVTAIEKDDRLIETLRATFAKETKEGRFTLIHGDILDFPPQKLVEKPYKLVANIPYYITGLIIRTFLENTAQPSLMVLLVQKEVADRILARDGKESLLSISVKAYGTPSYIDTVKAGSFVPAPSVDSAILRIDTITNERLEGIGETHFFTILRQGFSQKRKQLRSNLSIYGKERVTELFAQRRLAETVRAEDITLDDWLAIARNLPPQRTREPEKRAEQID